MLDRIVSAGKGAWHALRVAGFAGILVLCTAMSCHSTASDIQYAPGYGYVITVTCLTKCSGENDVVYRVFNTYQEAKDWQDQHKGGLANLDDGPYINRGDLDFDKITKLLRPAPAPLTSPDGIELNQPQPYVPQ